MKYSHVQVVSKGQQEVIHVLLNTSWKSFCLHLE